MILYFSAAFSQIPLMATSTAAKEHKAKVVHYQQVQWSTRQIRRSKTAPLVMVHPIVVSRCPGGTRCSSHLSNRP